MDFWARDDSRRLNMDNQIEHGDWQPCPPGEMTRLAKRLDSLQRGARFNQLVGTGLLSMFLCAVGTVLIGGYLLYQEPNSEGYSCRDCQAHAAEFHDLIIGKKASMDAKQEKLIRKHLKKCNGCRAKFQQAFPDVPPGPLATCEPCLHRCMPKLSTGTAPTEF
jgi:hypothetical protein